MSIKCKIGLHSWDGCKCSECSKTRDEQHDWSTDCETCSTCGLERKDEHKFKNGKCILCEKKQGFDFSFLNKEPFNPRLNKQSSTSLDCAIEGKQHKWKWQFSGQGMICSVCGKERQEDYCKDGKHQYYGPYGTTCGRCGATRDF